MFIRKRLLARSSSIWFECLFVCILFTALPSRLVAAERDATWLGGTGSWTIAGAWSGGVVPNNNVTDSFRVFIDGGNVGASVVDLNGSAGTISINYITVDAGDTLVMNNQSALTTLLGATINGAINNGWGSLTIGPGGMLDGTGEIFSPSGKVLTLGSSTGTLATGAMTIGPTLRVHAFSGAVGNALGPLTSFGTISADGASLPSSLSVIGSIIQNAGTLVIGAGGTLSVNVGSYSSADLGTVVNNGGLLRLGGHLYNAGNTFVANSATRIDGTMHGGTLEVAAGQTLRFDVPGTTLENVWINGAIQVHRSLRITGDGVLRGNNLVVILSDRIAANITPDSGTLTISPGVVVKGTGTVGGGRPLINQGTLLADGAYIGVNGATFVNQGVLEVRNGGTLRVGEQSLNTTKTADLGDLRYGPGGGTFQIGGILDNTGNTLVNGAPVRWWLASTLRGGTLKTLPGNDLSLPEGFTAALDNVTLDHATIVVTTGSIANSWLVVSGPLHGQGTVLLGSNGVVYSRNETLVVEAGITILGARGTVGLYGLDNRGTILAQSNGTLILGHTEEQLINHGSIRATESGAKVKLLGTGAMNDGIISIARNALVQSETNLTIGDTGVCEFVLGPTDSGRLIVNGDLDLTSQGDYLMIDTTFGTLGRTYEIATLLGTHIGVFDHVIGNVSVDYSVPGNIRVTMIPECASGGMISCLLVTCARRRRIHFTSSRATQREGGKSSRWFAALGRLTVQQ